MPGGSLSSQHGASSGFDWRNDFQIWTVTANILNKQLRTADEGWPLAGGLGDVLTTPHLKSLRCYETFHTVSVLN